MRTHSSTFLCLVLSAAMAAPALAQETRADAAGANPISQSMRITWSEATRNLQQSAELAPEEILTFRPTDAVRSFGEILAHAAGSNYMFCAIAKGEKAPSNDDEILKVAASKTKLAKAVADSIAYCNGVMDALTDQQAAEPVTAWGGRKMPRAAVLLLATSHLDLHYGNLVTYFRLKGIVPPSSRQGS